MISRWISWGFDIEILGKSVLCNELHSQLDFGIEFGINDVPALRHTQGPTVRPQISCLRLYSLLYYVLYIWSLRSFQLHLIRLVVQNLP